MRTTARRRTFLALTAAGAALCVAATASAASWTPPQKIENRVPVSSADAPPLINALSAANGRAAIVFRVRGNRLMVARRDGAAGRFGRPDRAFPAVRAVGAFATAMDAAGRLALAVGQTVKPNDPLVGIAGAIESRRGFGASRRISHSSGLTYSPPLVAASAKGDVFAAFSGETRGQGSVFVRSGSTRSGRYGGISTLRRLSGVTTVRPPLVDIGVDGRGNAIAAFELVDGSIATSRRSGGRWSQLPTIGLPVNGQAPDGFALDVPSGGPAVIAIAQGGNIAVQRLTPGAAAWSAPETVAAGAYTPSAQIPFLVPSPPASFNALIGPDVAASPRGDVAVAWGVNVVVCNVCGPSSLGYSRVLRAAADPAWPAATTSAQTVDPGTPPSLSVVVVEMDNARRAVAAFSAQQGLAGGGFAPLAVSTFAGTAGSAWSATEDFRRFCGKATNTVGPSMAASGGRGVLMSWGCGSEARTIFARQFR